MQPFVILFRQATPLSEEARRQRAEETAAWARGQNDSGHALDPHILGAESVHAGADGVLPSPPEAAAVTALLFLQARDLREAARIAESHPAIRYGASIEVRPWARPKAASQVG